MYNELQNWSPVVKLYECKKYIHFVLLLPSKQNNCLCLAQAYATENIWDCQCDTEANTYNDKHKV